MSTARDIMLSTWNRCFIRDKKLVPKIPAVYAFASLSDVLYIGTSECLYNRVVLSIADHPIRSLYPYSDLVGYATMREYLACNYNLEVLWQEFLPKIASSRYALENTLIKEIKPYLNDTGNRANFINSCWQIEKLEREKQGSASA